MRRIPTLWEKLKTCYIWLFQLKDIALVMNCSFCRHISILLLNSNKRVLESGEHHYRAEYYCRNCGAVAIGTETWMKVEQNDDVEAGTESSNQVTES